MSRVRLAPEGCEYSFFFFFFLLPFFCGWFFLFFLEGGVGVVLDLFFLGGFLGFFWRGRWWGLASERIGGLEFGFGIGFGRA